MKPWLSKGQRSTDELPLQRDDNSRFMPWIMAVMVFLMTLSLSFAFAMRASLSEWSSALTATLTVQVPAPSPVEAKSDTADARAEKIVTFLRQTEGIAKVQPLNPAEAQELLETWLGEGNVKKELPVPRLIDVTLDEDAELDFTSLQTKLSELVPGTIVDDHKAWMEDLLGFIEQFMLAIYIVCGLIAAASVVMIVFATRSGLVTHHRTIELLHIMGARNFYIARQFSRNAFWLGLMGGIIGIFLAGLVIFGVSQAFANVAEGLLPDWHLSMLAWFSLLMLPLFSGLFAMMTASATVLSKLSRVF